MTLDTLFSKLKGSSSSGNYGHSGRPGKRGGSAPNVSSMIRNSASFQKVLSGEITEQQFPHEYFKELGFAAFPDRVSSLDPYIQDGEKELYRGIEKYERKTGSELIEEFKSGDYFVGDGVYGRGTYTAVQDPDIPNSGITVASIFGTTFRMSLKKDAKVISYRDAQNLSTDPPELKRATALENKARDFFVNGNKSKEEIQSTLDQVTKIRSKFYNTPENQVLMRLYNDEGIKAASLGYDAISSPNTSEGEFIIVLNRGKVRVE